MECMRCFQGQANKGTGICNACEEVELSKINGILYLPAIGLCINMFTSIFMLYQHLNFLSLEFPSYAMNYLYTATVLLFINVIVVYFSAWTFFKKKKFIKKAMATYYINGACVILYLAVYPYIVFGLNINSSNMTALFSAAIGIFWWLPYFIFAKRIPLVFKR